MKGYFFRQFSLLAHSLAVLCCLLLLLTTGCVTNKEAMMHQPTHLGLGQFKTATIEIRSNMCEDCGDLDESELRLETQIISALRKNHAFEKVYPVCDTPSELQIIVGLTDVRKSSDFDHHFRIGFLIGRAVAEGTLEFRENVTGRILATFPLATYAFGNSDLLSSKDKATDHLAMQAVDVISRNLASDGSKETVKLQSAEALTEPNNRPSQ